MHNSAPEVRQELRLRLPPPSLSSQGLPFAEADPPGPPPGTTSRVLAVRGCPAVPWFKLTVGSKVYILDPSTLFLCDENGRYKTQEQILAEWRQLGVVDQLPGNLDPIEVIRYSWERR